MLVLDKISKIYKTQDLKQVALDSVSINFRKSEFVSILGPSGSGKSTLLNIIGGLDHYDTGDLIINNVSTKKYTDKNWDSYRNYKVGFVFQSYNLIAHQSVLQNVEIALTLSGISKKRRIKIAKKVLKEVGLEKHIKKRPSQLSGGQMQRVAIARALVNNPDILLADEPTGALDSVTSKQIMKLLKKVSKDKLVIMVTHNPELAKKYSNRIVKLKDGKIIDDSNSYDGKVNIKETDNTKTKKTSMNLLTALFLSLNNLMTKKGRTFLTAFAGSIGIIGIALILSLSSGVKDYINKTEKKTLSSYPINIEKNSIDMTSMMENNESLKAKKKTCKSGMICTTDDISKSPDLQINAKKNVNNLKKFKKFLDDNGGGIKNFATDIQYSYNLDLQVYSKNKENEFIKVNPNTFTLFSKSSENSATNLFDSSFTAFKELINNDDMIYSNYEILSGKLPSNYNEMVLIVDENRKIPLSVMYSLDIENRKNLTDLVNNVKNGKEVSLDSVNYDYNSLINKTYKLILNTDYYKKEKGKWIDKSDNANYMNDLIENGIDIKIVGILKVNEEASNLDSGYVGYTHELTEYVIDKIGKTALAKEQLESKNINVLNGTFFDGISNTYESTCEKLGIINLESPSMISIYPKDFNAKKLVENVIEKYNDSETEENKITYTDMVGVLLSSVTSIVNVVSYILIAFVAVSLVVSSIMIAIITYISVLERTKEIGILRAIGASKKDISRVFKAETIIEGLASGLLGVGIAYILIIPINAIIKNLLSISGLAHLKLSYALILVLISIILTVISGLVPARIASKKDPVESLRNE